MQIDGIRGQILPFPAAKRQAASIEAIEADHALVPIAPVDTNERVRGHVQRDAAFLAQLIAAKEQVPQARQLRRAEPVEVLFAYRTALTQKPATNGQNFARES
ncbi:MAG: hypothetical protein JO205_10960 [Pseudolabrys sp.]|nr:hypothetical protein [Pseudolabrys sp.]MBV9261879.1 hypothetical protein [Pseudolabrys sp.]